LLAAEACGGDVDAAMPAACAVEMVHAYSLIHDDLPAMDDDDLRRGRPTCHKAFDEATAILAGDALLTLAFEVLATESPSPETAAACCAALAHAAGPCQMVGGQADDVAAECHGAQWNGDSDQVAVGATASLASDVRNTVAQAGHDAGHGQNASDVGSVDPLAALESIHQRKTGAMIQVSLRLGALVAHASPEQLAALDRYGRRIGLTFQITDDLLDVQSNEATLGKRVGKDAKLGKLTFPGLLGLDRSIQYAQQLVMEAQQDVQGFGANGESLRVLAAYVLRRNR
jgi:geranylgeranyl diphosphate synthase, type II